MMSEMATKIHKDDKRPWLLLEQLLEQGDHDAVVEYIEALAPADTARAISRLDEKQNALLLDILTPVEAAEVLTDLPDEQAADLIEDIDPEGAAAIVEEMPDDEMADILGEMEEEEAEAILQVMERNDPEEAEEARRLLEYGEDTAGGILQTDALSFRESNTVREVLDDLRIKREEYSDYGVQYAYIISDDDKFVGVLRMRDVLLTAPEVKVGDIMLSDAIYFRVDTSFDEMMDVFEEYQLLGMPVVDEKGKLMGTVRKSAVMEAAEKRSKNTYLKASGIIGGEEFRTMPLGSRVMKRLMWLLPSLLLSILAASVIARYEETLDELIQLAMFLTIVSGLSGNSGNQSVAVSIRELALGLIKPSEFLVVFMKEIFVGLCIGLVLGLLLGGVAYLYQGELRFALVIGGALALNTMFSVLMGGLMPLLLRKLGVDPALASGPILTTVTDMCGFFLVLSLANLILLG